MLTLDGVEVAQGRFRLKADLSIGTPGITAVIGRSGAGKSTLLSLIAGIMRPDAGRIVWNGQDITGLAPGQRPIAMLFQDNNLFPHLSVFRNVALGLTTHRRPDPDQFRQIEQVLTKVGIAHLKDARPGSISGGEQSRVALARILLQRRPLLLLDEPFEALGPAMRLEMLDLVADVVRETGAMALMVTHAPEDARRVAVRSILVSEGRAQGPFGTLDVLSNPPDDLKSYLGP